MKSGKRKHHERMFRRKEMRTSILEKAKKLKSPFCVVCSWSGKKVIHGVYQTEKEAESKARKIPGWKYYYTKWEMAWNRQEKTR